MWHPVSWKSFLDPQFNIFIFELISAVAANHSDTTVSTSTSTTSSEASINNTTIELEKKGETI